MRNPIELLCLMGFLIYGDINIKCFNRIFFSGNCARDFEKMYDTSLFYI